MPSYSKASLKSRVEKGSAWPSTASSGHDNLQLSLVRDAKTNELRPRVEILDATSLSYAGDLKYAGDINGNAYARPPDILMETPPTESETVEAFRLSKYQAIAFRKVVRTLEAEKKATCLSVSNISGLLVTYLQLYCTRL